MCNGSFIYYLVEEEATLHCNACCTLAVLRSSIVVEVGLLALALLPADSRSSSSSSYTSGSSSSTSD